jgi:phosphoglycolate phosphatase-like HAD superfamily hydrolase
MAGRIESEIFFDALALNEAAVGAPPARKQGSPGSSHSPGWTVSGSDQLLAQFTSELAASFGSRQALLPEQGRVLPGALEAVSEVSRLHGVVQAPLTGTIKPNAVAKLRAFGLAEFFDVEVGGYGSGVYPKGAQLLMTRGRAAEKYGVTFDENSTVYIGDSSRDVEAARVGGARCIAVASGRSTASELRDAGADVVFADLADTAAVITAIDRLTMLRAAG